MCAKAASRLLWVLLLCTALSRSYASVVYVDRNATGSIHNGASWGSAFLTVRAAVNAAKAGDELWIASGTYSEGTTLTRSIALYGGFSGTEKQRSERDWKANPTILDSPNRTGSLIVSQAAGVVLDGLSISNAENGVYAYTGSTAIANCTITGNSGVGVWVEDGSVELTNCTLSGNTQGVQMYPGNGAYQGNGVTIANCAFRGQSADIIGGAGCDLHITGCVLTGNSGGLGISLTGGKMTAANCLIWGRSYGVFTRNANADIRNCTVCDNTMAGVYTDSFSSLAVTNSIVAFNPHGIGGEATGNPTIVLSHNNVYGNIAANYDGPNPTGTDGNISQDPLVVNRASGNYHLLKDSPCIDVGDDSAVAAGAVDLDGNSRKMGAHVDLGACEFMPATSVSLGTTLPAPPAAVDGVVYAGGEDGKLYAYTSPDLRSVAGFPVDISAAVGASVSLNSRPAVYFGQAGKAIFLTTSLGHVVKVWPNGQVAWVTKPINGPAMSTPAVTSTGSVYVDLGLQNGPSAMNFVFRLDETSGRPTYVSSYLGSSASSALSDRSAAIDQRYCYVNASGQALGSLAVLNQDNLTMRASFAPGEDTLPPYLAGASLYIASRSGNVYKANSVTMNPDLSFGNLGRVKVGEGITAGPFLDAGGSIYVGTSSGKVYRLDGSSGARALFLDSGTGAAVTGLVALRSGIVAFTTTGGLWQVPVSNPAQPGITALDGPPVGGPVYDPIRGRLFVTTLAGRLYSVPVL